MNRRARIGVFVNELLSPYQIRLFNSIKRAANASGVRVIGFQGSFLANPDQERRTAFDGSFIYGLAGEESVDGLIIAAGVLSSRAGSVAVRDLYRKTRLPVVSVGRLAGVVSIETGAGQALRAVIEHLVAYHGRRKIALIEGPAGNMDSIERGRIVRETLQELKVPLPDAYVLPGDFLEMSGAMAIRSLLDRRGVAPSELDTVVAYNDQMAVGAIRELTSRGIRVPQDVSVVGFDDDDFARSANPPLTTVSQPIELMGESAIHAVMAKLRGEPVPDRIILDAEAVWRRSCGCLAPMGNRFASVEPVEDWSATVENCKKACYQRYERLAGLLADGHTVDTVMDLVVDPSDDVVARRHQELENLILRACKNGIDPLRWHDVLSPVASMVERRAIADGIPGRQRERRMRHVNLLINDVAARVRALDQLHTTQWAHSARVLANALLSVRHVRSLGSVLSAGLPSLGLRYCCVCLFVDEAEPRTARVAALYNPSLPPPLESPRSAEQLWLATPGSVPPEQPVITAVNSIFPAFELVHPQLRNSSADTLDLSVYPLVYAHATLGYVVFDAPVDAHQSWLLEGLAGSLSSAVYALQRNAELREARDKAERANAAKTEFVAMISHEVRTPLTAIIGHIDLCMQTQLTAEQSHHLQQAVSSSKSLIGIVNDILDFSKIEAQRIELECLPFALDEVLDQVVATCAQTAIRKGLRLVVDVSPEIPHWLRGDSLRLGQVLLNLVGNAVKFSSRGDIRVMVSQIPAPSLGQLGLRFAIQDEGIGMSSEEISRIFDPFTQGDGSMTRKYGGTGLGLTISRKLVVLMGGDISVSSEPGRGSRFEFDVCLKHCELPTEELIRGAGKRILVVESDDLMRESLQHLLQGYGFNAECVADVEGAVHSLQRARQGDEDYHLLICDHDAEALNAMVLVNRVASELEEAGTHVLLLSSADAEFVDAQLARMPNLLAVVQKPFQRRHLTQVIARALTTPCSRSSLKSTRSPSFRAPAGTQILVIQDDPTTSELLCEILSKSGASVCVANCGQDAIESVKLHPFDLIFQDLHLPDMDGYTTAKAIRATSNGATVPILALSASSIQNNLAQCLAAGINDFIMAPVDAQALLRMVRLWVGGEADNRDANDDFTAFTYSGLLQEVVPGSPAHHRVVELDVESALSRLGRDESLYLKLLKRFVQSYQHTSRAVRQALARDDLESAVLSVHTLASAAGNIGASYLAEIARTMESSLRRGEQTSQNERLTDLEMAENRTARAAEAYLSKKMLPDKAKSEVDVKAWLACAERLRSLIDAHDSAALEELIQLRGVLGARASAGEVFLRLEASVVAYDFDQARNHLEVLMNWMQHTTGTTAS
jgi:signal transduction histidine kinase/DNA-binding LacI/PurR family transcriptional regulator/DNA-binding response OmpR family regulator